MISAHRRFADIQDPLLLTDLRTVAVLLCSCVVGIALGMVSLGAPLRVQATYDLCIEYLYRALSGISAIRGHLIGLQAGQSFCGFFRSSKLV